MKKSFILINSLLTFAIGFIIHGLYEWFPCFITSIFPVNESLFEHMKLIFFSPLIASTITYFIYKKKGFTINNFFLAFFISTFFNIVIFYLTFIPIYNDIGENLLVTLIVYLITILLSQWVYYLIIEEKHAPILNIISLILSIVSVIIMTYFTYNPIKSSFFLDPKNKTYGITK